MLDTAKPAAPDAVERALEAVLAGHKDQKLTILAFAAQENQILTSKAREHVAVLAEDKDHIVRGEALAVVVRLDDPALLKRIVASGWSATPTDGREKGFELWHGSKAMIRAAKHGLLTMPQAIGRINVETFGIAARELGEEAGAEIAPRLAAAFERTLSATITLNAPRAEREVPLRSSAYPTLLSLADEPQARGGTLQDRIDRMNDTPEDFDRRQREAWEAFKKFEAELTDQDARLFLEDVSQDAIKSAIASSPTWGTEMARAILEAPPAKLYHVSNFGYRLARGLSESEPILSRAVYERIRGHEAHMSVVYGPSAIPLETFCAWGAADNAEWDAVRTARLDDAPNDEKLASEVLAALLSDKAAFLQGYVAAKLARPEPVEIARAITVLGFGEPSTFADETINRYQQVGGFIGNAAKQARYGYDRNVWSRHWYRLMGEANSAEEYWRWSVLLRKIVDGRFALWHREDRKGGGPAALFDGSLDASIKKRIKSWKPKREKLLLGTKAPSRVFVSGE